ncbi:cellulose 1,4-beta-cellobiosidase precursor [Tricladium varicosporioides]|nr:cellulose 1,4-beta-cellobiosidase precursor [Hymenoscyphus varicosporioides]
MHRLFLLHLLTVLSAPVVGQKAGNMAPEFHPRMTWESCTADKKCVTQNGSLVMDANWRWIHSGHQTCLENGTWAPSLCPSPSTCTSNCAIESFGYSDYGINPHSGSLTLKYSNWLTEYATGNGARLFMLKDKDTYEIFKLLNKEVTFDVDVGGAGGLGCGLGANLYFVGMESDGGKGRWLNNTVGAAYGTGYCDSGCPRTGHFIEGNANINNWITNIPWVTNDQSQSGTGTLGSCCSEISVFNVNYISTSFGAHTCNSNKSPFTCEGSKCGGVDAPPNFTTKGPCDFEGCTMNPYRMGDKEFFGPGKKVDTNKKFTVVTQFITDDSTDTGILVEIKRFYIQNGTRIENSKSQIEGLSGNSLTSDFCMTQKLVFIEEDTFSANEGFKGVGDALRNGLVMVISIVDDRRNNMKWLDGTLGSGKGGERGSCATNKVEDPKELWGNHSKESVTFARIRVGAIGSTI